MTIVIDTAVVIDHLRGDDAARQALRAAADAGARLACSLVTKVEVLAGMRGSEEDATRGLFGVVEWIVVDDGIAERAGRLANRFFSNRLGCLGSLAVTAIGTVVVILLFQACAAAG